MAAECNKTSLNYVALLVFLLVKKKVNFCEPPQIIFFYEMKKTHNPHRDCWIWVSVYILEIKRKHLRFIMERCTNLCVSRLARGDRPRPGAGEDEPPESETEFE